ncbi:hypothetical protein FRC06_000613 [Ceratobasidium sp. 370]|nr:hypothetical protein FRC06_000613 [Ceratobasidium sp. 370]
MSTTFQGEKIPSWADRMNIKKTLDLNLGCNPTTLVAGGTYQTPNGAFTYTIQNFVERNTREVFSSARYNGSTLSNCHIQLIGMFANFAAMDALFEAHINCTLADNIEMIAIAPSLITLRLGASSSVMGRFALQEATRNSYLTVPIFRLLAAFGTDFLNQFLPDVPVLYSQPINTIYSEFVIGPDMNFTYQKTTWSITGSVGTSRLLPEIFSK